jgi:hypothetical protein
VQIAVDSEAPNASDARSGKRTETAFPGDVEHDCRAAVDLSVRYPLAPSLRSKVAGMMNADGSGVRKLTHSKGVSENAAWSPDGSRIAFDAGSGIRKWSGRRQHLASDYGDTTWYGALPGRPSWRPIR